MYNTWTMALFISFSLYLVIFINFSLNASLYILFIFLFVLFNL